MNSLNTLSSEEKVLQLKRLLVTLKQKYEQTLHMLQNQLQAEMSQKQHLQKEFELQHRQLQDLKKEHDAECSALVHQQTRLKELLQNRIDTQGINQMSSDVKQKVEHLENMVRQQDGLQDKYEGIKEDLFSISSQLEEALDARLQAEQQLQEFKSRCETLESSLQDQDKMKTSSQECKQQMDDAESRLKTAQHHLAKKVKETSVLNEQIQVLQSSLFEHQQAHESAQAYITQLRTELESHQKQEKRLQDSLHESLKANESLASKWEEKYFRMYDKWQQSEEKIDKFKNLEDKHRQMLSFFSNFGSFLSPTDVKGFSSDERPVEPPTDQEKYDVFGSPHIFPKDLE